MKPLSVALLAVLSAVSYCWVFPPVRLSDNPVAGQTRRIGKSHYTDLLLVRLNREYQVMHQVSAALTWRSMAGESGDDTEYGEELMGSEDSWRNMWCDTLHKRKSNRNTMTKSQKRQIYLFCRGPKYTPSQSREVSVVLDMLSSLYVDIKVCRGLGPCYRIEPDLRILMKTSTDPAELLWGWEEWRNAIGPSSRKLYPALISLQNEGAKNNGYKDIGMCWREELEIDDLEEVVQQLFLEVRPLFQKLHAYVRFKLKDMYSLDPHGLLPAHLLGDMWAQNWESLMPLVSPTSLDLNAAFLAKNYSIADMVHLAEDFYRSLGLPPLPHKFWLKSQFVKPKDNPSATCHGASANMFNGDDFRLLMCASGSLEDFYIIHHELGHIHYYMAYKDQPTIFQDGANSAFHESIGDTIMYSVLSPHHLQGLGMLDPSYPHTDLDIALLLRMALNKIPQLAFGLILDKWRWGVMNGSIPPAMFNKAWWDLHAEYLGVGPPTTRTEDDFDAGAKAHIANHIPYIRYFLSGFLQMQFLETMCRAAQQEFHTDLSLPLHRCDFCNSSRAGDKLRDMMELGSSVRWRKALRVMTEEKYDFISAKPLLNYYQPLSDWLDSQISQYSIPVGTDRED